jgi:hypothetical protein
MMTFFRLNVCSAIETKIQNRDVKKSSARGVLDISHPRHLDKRQKTIISFKISKDTLNLYITVHNFNLTLTFISKEKIKAGSTLY